MTQPTKFSACLALLLLVLLTSPALGFTNPKQMVASTRHTSNGVGQHQTVHLAMSGPNSSDVTRSDFFNIMASVAAFMPSVSNGFEGGVGGLGKTRPQTGVVFRDPEAAAETTQSSAGDVTYELVAPDGTPVFLSFNAPYQLLPSAAGIEARDLGGYESSFVQVIELSKGTTSLDKIKPLLFSDSIFGISGKFGAYGEPTDIKIKKLPQTDASSGTAIYQATFTTLTPAMRESDRKAYISASIVGNGLFLLVTTTTAARFGKLEVRLKKVAESFTAIDAPKSNLKQRKSS